MVVDRVVLVTRGEVEDLAAPAPPDPAPAAPAAVADFMPIFWAFGGEMFDDAHEAARTYAETSGGHSILIADAAT